MEYIPKKVAAYGQFVLVFSRLDTIGKIAGQANVCYMRPESMHGAKKRSKFFCKTESI